MALKHNGVVKFFRRPADTPTRCHVTVGIIVIHALAMSILVAWRVLTTIKMAEGQ